MPEQFSLTYTVPGASCAHCQAAIAGEVAQVEGVGSVDVDLETKRVTVLGERLDDAAVRRAIDQAGYEVAS
ncbi:MAG: heavy-metal-associated domain-containing protein [Actinomycetota bacterium]|nr:heavy-metal-associated domain-containing protein [Actinomycetota bacterium]